MPLDEVHLIGDVLLDGARVLPEALARGGYTVRVVGEGRHKVELRFQVGRSRFGDGDTGQQVRFVAPPLVQNRLVFQLPEGATYPRVAVKHGAMRLGVEGGSRRLEVELGAVASPLQLRWHQEARPAKAPRLEYREAYLWNLRADASLLTALVRYAVRGGAVTSLSIDLPPGLEVRSAQARRPAAGEGKPSGDAVRLSGWSVEGAAERRAVRLDFPVPVSGEVELTLELAPSAPWGRAVLLPLPRPRGEPETKTPGYLAYRRQGLEVTRTNWLRLTGLRPAEFAPFWTGSGRPAAGPLDYASSFRRDPRQPPELSLAPRLSRPALEATQEVTWQFGPTRAELAARLDLTSPGKDLSLVEYLIDSPAAVTIAGVTGPDVNRWSQSGSRLLVWLEKTVGATRIELSGWVPLATPKGGPARLDLPCLRPEGAAKSATRLVLRPAPGLALGSAIVRQLTAERPGGAGELVYAARQASYGGSFAIQPGPAPTADVVTEARRDGDDLVFVATIDYRFPGEARSLGVRLRGWDGDSWLETPAKTESRRREQHRRAAGRRERSWALDLAPGVTDRYRLILRGRLPLEGATASVAIPEVIVAGAQTRQLVRVEDGLVVEGAVGVVAEERGWRSAEEGWSLRVAPRQSAAASPVRVLLTEGRSYVADGARWRHEARLWVRHERPAELRLRLPVGAESAGVQIDGVPSGVVEGSEAWLPLPGPSGVVEVVVAYQFGPRHEAALEQPELAPPWVEGARSGPLVWTVNVPAGWEVTSSSRGTRLGDGPTRRAVVELHRAEAELARGDPAARQRAARSLSLARLALKTGAEGHLTLGPDGVPLSRWLADLQARLEEAGEPAAEPPGKEEASRRGTPHSWRQDRAEGGLVVRLAPESRAESRQAVAFSAGWLAALIVAWAVTVSATPRSAARWLWPEALVTAALLGGYLVGPTLAVLVLASVGVTGRAAIAGRMLRGITRRPAPATGSSRR